MRVQLRTALSPSRRSGHGRRTRLAPEPCARPLPETRKLSPEQRVRQAGGPEDRALYRCGCGFAFEAPVSTTVDCPHCGGQQAW